MIITEFIEQTDFNKNRDAWTVEIGRSLTKSLVINTYEEAVSILSSNALVNFFTSSDSFSIFLDKKIEKESIGSLISKDKLMWKRISEGWIYPSALMEFASDEQLDVCAKYILNESLENISYEVTEKNTPIKYCISQIKDYGFSKGVSINLVKRCSSSIVDETISRTEKYIKSLD